MAIKVGSSLTISAPSVIDTSKRVARRGSSAYLPAADAAANLKPGQSITVNVPKDMEQDAFRNNLQLSVKRLLKARHPDVPTGEFRFYSHTGGNTCEIHRMSAQAVTNAASKATKAAKSKK